MAEFHRHLVDMGKIVRAYEFLIGPTIHEAPGFSSESVKSITPAAQNPGEFTKKYPSIGNEYKRSVKKLAWARLKGYQNTVEFLEDNLTKLSQKIDALEGSH